MKLTQSLKHLFFTLAILLSGTAFAKEPFSMFPTTQPGTVSGL